MLVGRRIEYFEVYDIDMGKFETIRDNLDFCQRILWAADPVLTKKIRSGNTEGIKLISRVFDRISANPVYPVPEFYLNSEGVFE